MHRFYTDVALAETFQDIDIIATSNPCIRAQLRKVGCSGEIIDKCKRILIVDVGYACGVRYVV